VTSTVDDHLMKQADWVKQQQQYYKHPREITDDQMRCIAVLCAAGSAYNLPINWERVDWISTTGLLVRYGGELATYDSDGLTAIVLAAHRLAVRVAIQPSRGGRPAFFILLTARSQEHDSQWGRHPTIEQAIARRQQ
jgi:hypothetical protein